MFAVAVSSSTGSRSVVFSSGAVSAVRIGRSYRVSPLTSTETFSSRHGRT
ncbi:hypothetical protein C475_18591, partial [Halosimplex carlsbadense 2-9-1]